MTAKLEKIITGNLVTKTSTIIYKNAFFTATIIFFAAQFLELLFILSYQHKYSNLCNWDCGWYKSIVENGYDLEPSGHARGDAANWAFFPALPFTAKVLFHIFGLSSTTSLILTGKAFFLLSIFSFIKFVRLYNPAVSSWLSGMIIAFSPYAIYGNVGYTEPLFLFWACSFFYFLKQREYVKSGLCGAALTSSRVAGLFAVFSYAISSIKQFYSKPHYRLDIVLGALLIPFGLACFMLLLYLLVGDGLAFSHIQRAWGREPQNPLWIISKGLHGSAFDVYSVSTALFAIFLSMILVIQRRYELAIFTLLCTIVPLSTGLWSLPRYVWWQAPLLLLAAEFMHKTRSWLLIIPLSISGLVFMYFSWFSGKDFVI